MTVLALYFSQEHDCVEGKGIWEWGGAVGCVFASCGVLALAWTWRWKWLLAVGAFVVTFVPTSVISNLNALGDCTN